jgi:hypothetical protein
LKIRGEKEKKKRFQLLPAVEKRKNELSRGTIIFKTKNTPPHSAIEYAWFSLSTVCEFFFANKKYSIPFHFQSPCWRERKKNKVTFCGTRIENELFLDSCFARDLAGVDTTWEEREKVSPYSH